MASPTVARVILAVHLIVTGITAGSALYIALVELPFVQSLTTEEYARAMRAVLPRAVVFLLPALLVALFTAVALWFGATAPKPLWMAVGLSLWVVLGVSLATNIPINYELFAGGNVTSERLEQLRQRWEVAHWARTAFVLLAFVLAVIGVSRVDRPARPTE